MDEKFHLEVALQNAHEEVRRGVRTDGGELLKVFKPGKRKAFNSRAMNTPRFYNAENMPPAAPPSEDSSRLAARLGGGFCIGD